MKPQNNYFNSYIYISILIFTFYIINKISIIILHPIMLLFLIFKIKYCLTVLEQPGGGTHALNVMTIRDQSYANVSKQTMLLAEAIAMKM